MRLRLPLKPAHLEAAKKFVLQILNDLISQFPTMLEFYERAIAGG